MIQIITYDISKYNDYSDKIYKISKLGEIQALDDFEICIIDLSNENIWKNDNQQPNSVNCYRDLITIKEAIINSNRTKIVIVFPQNKNFSYNKVSKYRGGNYYYFLKDSIQIKDNRKNLIQIISDNLFELGKLQLSFEKTKTSIENQNIDADFNFINYEEDNFEVVTYSKNSNKITSIRKNNIILTTLELLDKDILKLFIDNYCMDHVNIEEMPNWLNDIIFFNDEELNKNKNINLIQIDELKQKIMEIDKQLKKNLEYKSILYTNGEELVKVVFEILNEILECNLSEFVDEKREDFLIKKEDVTFVGEIKGLSSAIQNKNISQLEVHIQNYFDRLQAEGKEEKVKGILIINHQRNKPLEERQEVHEYQKKLATKYELLIIETETLLKIYEKYKLGDITKEKVKSLLKDTIGLLTI